jgi:uncharacterized repeat protein (TIGR03806 family)
MAIRSITAIAAVAGLILGCGGSEPAPGAETASAPAPSEASDTLGPVVIDPDAKPEPLLSSYRFFQDGARQIPNEGVIPYDINTPLFSDYTEKYRFLWLPPGTAATYDAEDVFAFPVGAVILKTFSSLNDLRDPSQGERIIETRLLVHASDGWKGYPYLWNEDATEATLKVSGTTVDVEWVHYDGSTRSNNYIVPNMNQCKSCHDQGGALVPIGPKARNLNKDYAYADGVRNQLMRWTEMGYLTGAPANPDDAPRLAVWDDPSTGSLYHRGRAWLEANCMHCHNPEGPANTSGVDWRIFVKDPAKLGIMKPPVAAGRGAGDRLYGIVPGKPDESILMYRIESQDPGVMMPELPRRLIDEEGVALMRAWIEDLTLETVASGG